uniref:Fucosyltransferase n=1 Tax=Panagrolaimus sp. ES5 TaxID=591445 RepID=A0AC34FP33_9BILA
MQSIKTLCLRKIPQKDVTLFENNIVASNIPILLEWNPFNYVSTFHMRKKCSKECFYTSDKSLEPFADMLTVNFGNPLLKNIPKSRNENRMNVFICYESPLHRPLYKEAPKDYFNITVTYRLDSDVTMLYDFFEPVSDASKAWDQDEVNKIIDEKTNPALYFVSHCDTPSKRELIVEELKKYINITQYGNCNKKFCEKGGDCEIKDIRSHYFTLAFENSDCVDYVTEKVYRLRKLIVPIILNRNILRGIHAKLNPYVIALSDFKTVKELADFLKYLMKNKVEYSKYLEWTKFYKKVQPKDLIDDVQCELCEIAWKKKFGYRKVIPDIHQWWGNNNCHDLFGSILDKQGYMKFMLDIKLRTYDEQFKHSFHVIM